MHLLNKWEEIKGHIMFLTNYNEASAYANIGLETGVTIASPNKLTIMLYEGAITSCILAIERIKSSDIQNKSALITKAIDIIQSGLAHSLNKEAGGEIANNLDALYTYMVQRLYAANIQNDITAIDEVVKLLVELKSAWEAIEPSHSV